MKYMLLSIDVVWGKSEAEDLKEKRIAEAEQKIIDNLRPEIRIEFNDNNEWEHLHYDCPTIFIYKVQARMEI